MSEVERYISTRLLPLASGWNRSVAPHAYVRASDYDALAAENERLRVKLMTIASADPRYHGIEWAKAHAAENDNRAWLKWKEAIDEREELLRELKALITIVDFSGLEGEEARMNATVSRLEQNKP